MGTPWASHWTRLRYSAIVKIGHTPIRVFACKAIEFCQCGAALLPMQAQLQAVGQHTDAWLWVRLFQALHVVQDRVFQMLPWILGAFVEHRVEV
ncbi:MAG: hypothetical protein ABF297_01320, partial [Thiogranum sp.]